MDADVNNLNKRIRDELFALCRNGAMRPLLEAIKEHFPLLKHRKIGLSLNFVASYFSIDQEDAERQAFPVGGIITSFSLAKGAEGKILEKLDQEPDKNLEVELSMLKEKGMKNVNFGLGFLEPPASKPKMCSACNGTGFSHE